MLPKILTALGFNPRTGELDDFRSIYLERRSDGQWFATAFLQSDQPKGERWTRDELTNRKIYEESATTIEEVLAKLVIKARYPDE